MTQPVVLTVGEVAELLKISKGYAYALIKDGTIPSIKFGRRVLVPYDVVPSLVQRLVAESGYTLQGDVIDDFTTNGRCGGQSA